MSLDVRFNEDFSRIIASRITIQTYEIDTTQKETAMVKAYRALAESSPFNITVFNPNFILFDQYTMVQPITIQAVAIAVVAMVIISLIFIPNPWCSLLVGVAILSIETGVVGYMALWGVNLDQISMINLIMCIGFSVDFSAHISYAYLTAKVDTNEERIRECLYSLGLPILQGGFS
ncbi:Patched domain-containing protein 3, partial [Armadillidium vulgare]